MSTNDPGAGVGVPAAPPAAPGSGGVPASPADGGAAASPAAPVTQPVEHLRREYESTKAKLEPWEKLGAKYEDVSRSHQTYTKLHSEAVQLGQQLGLDAATVEQYFNDDPADTLATLRQSVQQRQGQEKPLTRAEAEKIADARAKELLKPFQQEREQALDMKAEQTFDGEIDRQIKTSFPHGFPEKNTEALRGLAWQLLNDNKDGYTALRGKGDTSAAVQAFEKAKETLLLLHAEWGEHEKTRIGTGPPTERKPAATKAASIDDIISNLGNSQVPMNEVFSRR